MVAPKVVFRIGKLKTWGQLGAAAGHNLRARPTPNAGPGGVIEVVPLPAGAASVGDAVRARIGDATIRKNAVLAVESIVSASPEYFRPANPSHAGTWDPARLEAWRAAVEPWIRREFPHAVSVVLHLDEATPHYQIIDVPLDERGRLNARAKYGGRAVLAAWQDRAAAAVAALGIERGLPGSLARHERVKAFYGAANQPVPPLPAIVTPPPEPLPPRTLAETVPMTGAKAARDAAEAKAAAQAAQHEAEIHARQAAKLKAWRPVAERANAVDLAQRKQRQAEDTASAKEAQAAALKEQADQLRALPLAEVLRRVYGAQLVPGSRDTHRVRQFALADGRKVGVSPADRGGEVWIEQGSQKGQRGAINLVMHLDGIDYRSAVRVLADHFDGAALAAEHARTLVAQAARDVAEVRRDPAPVPQPDPRRWPAVRRWLVEARALPGRLVDWLHHAGMVHADRLANAVFPRTGGGAFVRGTGPQAFHRTFGQKECGPVLIDGPGATWLCEAALDAASIKAHAPDARVIALGGALLSPADVRRLVPADRPVVLAFDRDQQGEAFERAAREIWPDAVSQPAPQGKDWNEAIQAQPALVDSTWDGALPSHPRPMPTRAHDLGLG